MCLTMIVLFLLAVLLLITVNKIMDLEDEQCLLQSQIKENHMLANNLHGYLEQTRPELASKLFLAQNNWDRAKILMEDSGFQILGSDLIWETNKKLLAYYKAKDGYEPNQ